MHARVRPASRRLVHAAAWALFLILTLSQSAPAQTRERIPLFAVDAQGALPKLPTDPAIAATRGLTEAELPGWGPGFNVAAHVYPLRGKWVALGVGGNYQWLRGSATADVEGAATVTTKYSAFNPQVSANFGHRRGWSYISAGIGSTTLTVSSSAIGEEPGVGVKTINYGGGGRWFVKPHLAFSWDLRIYAMNPVEQDELNGGHPRVNIVSMNIGVSFQ